MKRPLVSGIIVLFVIGNTAAFIAASYFAKQNQIDLVMRICLDSSVQVVSPVRPHWS